MWYKTGTINLTANNATVTGTGTAWADAKFGVMPGMILLAPDNKLYEVKQVNSNTSLTLNSNYAGSTASGQSYAIITTYEGDISQFSARFAAMLTFFQGSRNDTVSWFTGAGDMTFTKDDGTKLTVPTLAKIQADYVSRTATSDQLVAGPVRFTYATKLAGVSQSQFIPTSQGSWIGWGRDGNSLEGYNGGMDFINHRGPGTGGWNFWNTNGGAINLAAKLGPSGQLTLNGALTSVGDQVMKANTPGSNLIIRFKDMNDVEQGAIYNTVSTGQMTIRWGGASHSLIGKADGQLNVPRTLTFNAVHSQSTDVPDVANLPVIFRGHDTASFDRPNNFSIGTWFGFSIVPTGGNEILGPGVERGKPVFFVNSRTGTAHVLNNLYVGTKAVIKVGDYGLGGSAQHQDDTLQTVGRMYRVTGSSLNRPGAENNYSALSIPMSGTSPATVGYLFVSETGKLRTGISNQASGSVVNTYGVWGDYNTTVDANGFLKKASPIARLSSNPEKMSDEFLDGFTLSGLAAVNGEAAGVIAERVSVGVYKVTGSLGFALEGWNIEVPQDVNGNRLCFVATEAAEDGTITVKVSKRRFDIDTAAIVAGEPMDIPEGRWIDLRLEMPPVEEVQSEPEPKSHEGEIVSE